MAPASMLAEAWAAWEPQAVHSQAAEASLWAAPSQAAEEFQWEVWEVWEVPCTSVEEVTAAVVVQVPSWQAAGIVVL